MQRMQKAFQRSHYMHDTNQDQEWSQGDDHNDQETAFSIKEDHGTADPPVQTLNVFYKGRYNEMLTETYEKI